MILDLKSCLQYCSSDDILSDLSLFKSRDGSEEVCQFLQETFDEDGTRKNNFIDFEKKHLCRVYFVLSDPINDDSCNLCVLRLKGRSYPIYGFFSISAKILYESNLFNDQAIISKSNSVTYLIGHLCKNSSYDWSGGGLYMLQQCFEIIESVHQKIGMNHILVECSEGLVKYYSEQHFIEVGFNKRNNLFLMIRKVAEIHQI
jgi:hypothetical protein